jgi:hypothetical protein
MHYLAVTLLLLFVYVELSFNFEFSNLVVGPSPSSERPN